MLVPKNAPMPEDDFLPKAVQLGEIAADKRARDIRAYDVRGLTLIADAFVLCTVTSEPQLKAVYSAAREGMKELGQPPLHTEGNHQSGWLLLDFGSVIFHIFREEARGFYDLDGMWADAKEIRLELEEG